MQVLVLDPTPIPSSMDVVIGYNVYELHFRVEPEDMQDAPKPLDMEDTIDEFNKKEEERGRRWRSVQLHARGYGAIQWLG
jgi:hypothetical protein